MPDPVFGNDAYTAADLAEESSWGTISGSFLGIPIVSESLKLVYDFAPENPEFGGIGAQRSHEVVGSRIEGEIVFHARINGQWFNIFMAHLFGEEKRVVDVWVDGATATGGVTHFYLPNGLSRSLQLRAWKSGSSANGDWHIFSGLIFSACRIEFVESGLLQFSGQFTGKAVVTAPITGTPDAPTGTYLTSARMLTNANAIFEVGATLAAYDIKSFALNYNRSIEADSSFLNDLDTPIRPGPRANRQITVDIGALLYDNFMDAGKPSKEFQDRTFSKCRIIMTTEDTNIGGSGKPAAFMLDFPNIVWEDADDSLKTAGEIPVTYRFKAIEGASADPDHGDLDCRAATFVHAGALPNGDATTWYAAEVVQS